MSDLPDFNTPIFITGITIASIPIDIIAQSIGNIVVDIVAQSIGNILVDINAQTLTELNINIAAQDADVNVNITNATIIIEGTVEITGPVTVNGQVSILGVVAITGEVEVFGNVAIIGPVTVTGTVSIAGDVHVIGAVEVTGAVSVTGNVAIPGGVVVTGIVSIAGPVNIEGDVSVIGNVGILGTVEVLGSVSILGVVHVLGAVEVTGAVSVTGNVVVEGAVTVTGAVNILGPVLVTGAVEVSGAVTVSGTVAISGSVTITGAVTVSGTVAISGSVTITGAVTVTSGDIHIATTGGTNIVIDVLTQAAYLERRSTLSNNGVSASWRGEVGDNGNGKFFPRGARGFINEIDIYCKDNAAAGGTLTVYIAPYPGAGYIKSVDITIPASGAADWRTASFAIMWNYDSLFIYAIADVGDIQYGYDTGVPQDRYRTTDGGATWARQGSRLWFRADMIGQTAGEIPVGGTVNTIEIPHIGTTFVSGLTACGAAAETVLATIAGGGYSERIFMYTSYDNITIRLYVDGVLADAFNIQSYNTYGFTATTPKVQILTFGSGSTCYVQYTAKLEFTRELEIRAYNWDAASHNVEIWGAINLIK